ncbi:M48 family metallopeptidase [Thiolapillus sp.]
MIRRLLLPLIVTLLIGACSTSPTGRHQLMLVSPSQAVQASEKAYPEKLKEYAAKGKLNNKPRMLARVKRITGRLIAQAIRMYPESRNWQWEVVLIDDPEVVNAWCMAGGKMAVYSGLIEKIQPTDDELAQVMAHEISHALANHVAEQMSVAMASQLGLAVLSATALHDSRYRSAALTGAALAATLAIQLPYSRAAEAEADRIGIEIAARAGYDPNAAASLWRKMEQVSKDSPPELLNTHPSAANRQRTLSELAPKMMKYYHPDELHPVYPLD